MGVIHLIRYSLKLFLIGFAVFITACSSDSPSALNDADTDMAEDASYKMANDEATEEKALGFEGEAEESH